MIALASILVLALCAAGCQPEQPATSPQKVKLEVSFNPWPGFYPAVIAREQGLFEKHGVKVELITFPDTETHLAEIAAGRCDGALLSIGSAIIVAGANPDFRVVMSADQSAGADAIVARPGISSPADLRNRSIGAMLGGFGELFVLAMLQEEGLTRDDVILINTTGAVVPEDLRAGRIDAGQTWQPYVSRAVNDGAQVIFTSSDTPGLIQDVLIFQGKTLSEHPNAVRSFIDAWFEAVELWLADPDEGSRIIAGATDLGIKREECSLNGIMLYDREQNLQVFAAGGEGSLHSTAQLYADFYIQSGHVSVHVDAERLLDPSFLSQPGPP
jgi:NitT/TauT family transport system substrate-binding protein